MSVRQGSLRQRAARRGLIALGAVAVLALSGCASSIAGSAVAADAVPAAGSTDNDTDGFDEGGDAGALPVPSDGDEQLGSDGQMPDLSELEGLLGGLGGEDGQMPDLSDLQGLLGGLTGGGDGDISGLLDQLGDSGVLSPGCLQVSGALMSLGFLFMSPALGQSIDAKAVDDAFKNIGDVPAELKGDIQTLRQAAEAAVGKSGAEAQAIVGSQAVDDAMNRISDYLDASCGGN